MADIINTTSSAGLSVGMQTYCDRTLLKNMKPRLAYTKYGQKREVPLNEGKTTQFRRFTRFPPADEPLVEGVTPEAQELQHVALSDMLSMTHVDRVKIEALRLLGMQAAETVEKVAREALSKGTNVLYANGTSRSEVGNEHVLTSVLLRKAVRTLKKNCAQPFYRNGKPFFYAIVNPDTTYDLQDDPMWEKVATYQQAEKVESGEIGRLYGVVIIEATTGITFSGAGADGADIAGTIVFGQDAYGTINLEGKGAVRTIVKPLGSGGTSDPIEQRSTVAWKVEGYTAKILQDDWMVRIEHGMSA